MKVVLSPCEGSGTGISTNSKLSELKYAEVVHLSEDPSKSQYSYGHR